VSKKSQKLAALSMFSFNDNQIENIRQYQNMKILQILWGIDFCRKNGFLSAGIADYTDWRLFCFSCEFVLSDKKFPRFYGYKVVLPFFFQKKFGILFNISGESDIIQNAIDMAD